MKENLSVPISKKVKCAKAYEYIPLLISHILRRRLRDIDGVTQEVDLNQSDPALTLPTIAHVPPPPTKEIIARRSRFAKKQADLNCKYFVELLYYFVRLLNSSLAGTLIKDTKNIQLIQ